VRVVRKEDLFDIGFYVMEIVQGAIPLSNNLVAYSPWKCRLTKSHGNPWGRQVSTFIPMRWNSDGTRRKVMMDSLVRGATWSFGGNGNEVEPISERSENANEDILVFFFQLDIGTRIQCAMNMEQYELAQDMRNKLTEVETEIVKRKEDKHGSSSKSEAQDKAIHLLNLRSDLQKAIESENYTRAALLRDDISKLEADSLAASATALAFANLQYLFRLGEKVKHKIFGYEAIVCGMDPVCCESTSWMEIAQVHKLSKGANQPFYQVLVNVHTNPDILIAYGTKISFFINPILKKLCMMFL